MSNVHVITLDRGDDKWVSLLHHFQNSVHGAFEISFADKESARKAGKAIAALTRHHPTWFRMIVFQRGCSLYVIKIQSMHKVVLK